MKHLCDEIVDLLVLCKSSFVYKVSTNDEQVHAHTTEVN